MKTPTLAAIVLLSTGGLCAQVFHRIPTAQELAGYTEQKAAEAHARWAGVRRSQARRVVARTKARLAKLDRRVRGWRGEIPGFEKRIRDLRRSRGPRHTTMGRRLGTIFETVRRKIQERKRWIERAQKDIKKLETERAAALETLRS